MAIAESPISPLLGDAELRMVDIDELREHPKNIRESLGDLDDLVASIREKGVLIPLQVTLTGIVVCGHRRLAAARLAGVRQVPCIGMRLSEASQLEAMLIENLQRSDISALEEARGYQQLLDLGQDVDDVATRVQVRAARIRERTALLQLPNRARAALQNHEITLGAAYQLLKLRDHPDLIEQIVAAELDGEFARARQGSDRAEHEPVSSFYRVDTELQRLHQEKAVAEARARAEKRGLTVVDEPGYGRKKSDPQKIGNAYDELHIDAKVHVGKPCHAVAITRGGKLVPVCTKPSKHAKEVAEKAPATSRRNEPEPVDDVQARDEDRFNFLRDLLAREPGALSTFLPLLVLLGRQSYDEEKLCELLGIETAGQRYSTDATKKFTAWLTENGTVSDGVLHLMASRVVAASVASAFLNLQEVSYESDPVMAFIIRTLQREGYEPNAGELELLEKAPADAAEWFA